MARHVAGILGGNTYGVAKKTTIIGVKVFDGEIAKGADVMAGFDWAVNDIVSKKRAETAVVNLSLGGLGTNIWDNAITEAWKQGVLCVAASGNSGDDAADYSPPRSPEVLTVGNIQKNDTREPTSNYGSAVDIFAAGTDILSAYSTSDDATRLNTGTSMSAPYVVGLVSYFRGLEGPSSAAAVKARVLQLATPGRVTDTRGLANLIAYNENK